VSTGPVTNALAGYRLARIHARALLAVLLPVLTVALLGMLALDLLLGRDQTVIINGFPVVHADDAALANAVLVVTCWLTGLSAAALTVVGAARGLSLRPRTAILAALRRLPVFAGGSIVFGGGTALVLTLAAGLGAVAAVAALALAAGVASRLLVGLVARHFGGSGWALTRGRVVSTAGAVLLGGLVVPAVASMIVDRPPLPDLAMHVIGAMLVTVVVGAQAGIIARICLVTADLSAVDARLAESLSSSSPVPATSSAVPSSLPAEPSSSSSPAASSSLPAEPSSSSSPAASSTSAAVSSGWGAGLPRIRVTAAVALVALMAPVAVAAVDPFSAPTVQAHGNAPGGAVAMVWPDGKHPVIATMSGARFCDDDPCENYVDHTGGPGVMDDWGTAAIGADGTTVVKAMLTGGQDNGGPFVEFAACTRQGCQQAWVPARGSAREPFEWPELAAAVAPDQAVWFALAMPRAKVFEVTLIRCPDAKCASPRRHRMRDVERLDDDGLTGPRRVRLSVGADGRPELALRTGSMINVVTCDSITCAGTRTRSVFAGDGVWVAPALTFEPGRIRIEDRMLPLAGAEIASRSGAVASAGSVVYATAAEAAPRPGLHIRIGEADADQSGYWRQLLWRCAGESCARRELDGMTETTGRELLAVSGDGRVLIVRDDRILLVSAFRP
jgi:hypothetical protein